METLYQTHQNDVIFYGIIIIIIIIYVKDLLNIWSTVIIAYLCLFDYIVILSILCSRFLY
jgi:hypothetical protein